MPYSLRHVTHSADLSRCFGSLSNTRAAQPAFVSWLPMHSLTHVCVCLCLMCATQMFIGDGAKMVRDAFALAKEKSPCIIFIDEVSKTCVCKHNVRRRACSLHARLQV